VARICAPPAVRRVTSRPEPTKTVSSTVTLFPSVGSAVTATISGPTRSRARPSDRSVVGSVRVRPSSVVNSVPCGRCRSTPGSSVARPTKPAKKGVAGWPYTSSRRSEVFDPARVHDRNPVRQCQCLVLVMGDQDGRHPQVALQAPQFTLQVLAQLAIQCRKRFIQQKQRRAVG